MIYMIWFTLLTIIFLFLTLFTDVFNVFIMIDTSSDIRVFAFVIIYLDVCHQIKRIIIINYLYKL
jgi:hypothetical protein